MAIKIYELCGADPDLLFSPHCWKTRLSLAHKGLDYEIVPTPFTSVATLENGDGRKVPVIRDGDSVVEDSYDIALYLDETYPDRPALFSGDGSKALTQFVIQWSQTQVHPVVARTAILEIHNCLAPADQEFFRSSREKLFGMTLEEFASTMAAGPEDLAKVLVPLQSLLKTQPYIGGGSPLFADYVVFGPLQWLRTVKGDSALPGDGQVADWFNRLLDLYGGIGRKAKVA